jgi:hypothetical protein
MNRKTLLSLACAGASLIAMQAAAQEASVVDEIVVTGTKASLWPSALDVKRAQVGVVDSIAAEDIGKMP